MSGEWNRYGPTSAKGRGLGRRFVCPDAIDMHGHVHVPEADAALGTVAREVVPGVSPETVVLNRRQNEERRPNMIDMRLRLADLDAMGIARQVILPAPGQCFYGAEPEAAARATRVLNDGIAEHAREGKGRLLPFGSVPLQEPSLAVTELERCIGQLGFHGVEVLTNVAGRELSSPEFEPFWARAAALRVLVVLHPTGFAQPQRLGRFYDNNVIGNPLDTTLAVHHLILDGVLERHPDLRLMAVHGGGYASAYSGRLDHAWGARSDARASLPKPPSFYLGKIYLDSVVFDPRQLEFLIKVFGAGQILLGTDYPYDMADYDPLELLAAANLSDADRHAIALGNASRLLGL